MVVAVQGIGGGGAWEVVGRWSYLDLNDANIEGGRLNDLTFGVNWYLTPYMRLMANMVHSTVGAAGIQGNESIFITRAAIDW